MWRKNSLPSVSSVLIVLLIYSLINSSPILSSAHTSHGLRHMDDAYNLSEDSVEESNGPNKINLTLKLNEDSVENSNEPNKINITLKLQDGENDKQNEDKFDFNVESKAPTVVDLGKNEKDDVSSNVSGNADVNTDEDEDKSELDSEGDLNGDTHTDQLKDNKTSNANNKALLRSVKAGDIFTPHDLLPVTEKLLKKVDLPPGTGRGIVSGAKSKEDLADRIFAAYFLTTKRIVILKDVDIAGIDELQALAIKGDPKSHKYMVRKRPRSPKIVMRKPDSEIKPHLPPKRSIYKLVTKKETKAQKDAELKRSKQRNRRLLRKLQKKMPKNSRLIVNPRNGKNNNQLTPKSFRRAVLKPGCTWHYECRDPHNFKSCNLKAKCDNETLSKGFMEDVITPAPTEAEKVPANFRRAVGVSVIDEKVEKIIERHILIISPENLKKSSKLESIDEYFNKLMSRHAMSTTPMTRLKSLDENDSRNRKKSNHLQMVTLRKQKQNFAKEKSNSNKSEINEEEPENSVPFGLPLRKSNGLNSVLNTGKPDYLVPFGLLLEKSSALNSAPNTAIDTSVNKSENNTNDNKTVDETQEATPRIVRLIGKGQPSRKNV